MPNWYGTRGALKSWAGITGTADDAFADAVLSAVSTQLVRWSKHQYHVTTGVRYYTARPRAHPEAGVSYPFRFPVPFAAQRLMVDDLLAVTELATDPLGDRSYGTIWGPSDYDLEPFNAPSEDPPQPYYKIELPPHGTKTLPLTTKGVRITGKWGYYEQLQALVATVGTAGINGSALTLPVSGVTEFDVGQTLLIDSEQVFVTAVGSNSLTLDRGPLAGSGLNGTTRAAHSLGATIQLYRYPVIETATYIQGARIFQRRKTPLGAPGELGLLQARLLLQIQLDPDVQNMLVDFREPTVG